MMPDSETARTVIGIIGNLISLIFFLSPIPTFRKILKQKAVQEFKPDPYLATVINCAMWSFYGLPIVKEDTILLSTINAAGFVIELIYVGIFFVFAPFQKQKKIMIVIFIELIAMVGVVLVALLLLSSKAQRAFFVGSLGIILNLIMYTYMWSVMKMVIRTKSVKYMPFYLSLASLCNGTIWVVYSTLRFDIIIVIANSLGALAGLMQIILYATYYRTTQWDARDRENFRDNNSPQNQISSSV